VESRAYFLARGQYCIERDSERIAIPELFDTIAGSETGAIIASNLLIRNPKGFDANNKPVQGEQPNERFASATTDWFKDEENSFYYKYKFPMGAIFCCSLVVAIVFAFVGYRITDKSFESFEFDSVLSKFRQIFSYKKKILKNPEKYNVDEVDRQIAIINNDICDKKGSVRVHIDKLLVECQRHDVTKDELDDLDDRIHILKDEIVWKESLKWYVAVYGFIFTFFLFFFCIYPVFYYMVSKVTTAAVLKAAIISKDMIPATLTMDNIIPDKDIFITAWDLNNRTPRFFSAWTAEHWPKSQSFNNDLTLGEATLASMSSPEFVEPATINEDVYISGDNVAKSPALFAYMFEKKRHEHKPIRTISIGSVD
jgi:hypothetical protein